MKHVIQHINYCRYLYLLTINLFIAYPCLASENTYSLDFNKEFTNFKYNYLQNADSTLSALNEKFILASKRNNIKQIIVYNIFKIYHFAGVENNVRAKTLISQTKRLNKETKNSTINLLLDYYEKFILKKDPTKKELEHQLLPLLERAKKTNATIPIALIYSRLGWNLLYRYSEPLRGVAYMKKAQKLYASIQDSAGINTLDSKILYYFFKTNQVDSCVQILQNCICFAEKHKLIISKFRYQINLVDCYLEMNKIEKAKSILLEILTFSKQYPQRIEIVEANRYLSMIYKQTNHIDSSLAKLKNILAIQNEQNKANSRALEQDIVNTFDMQKRTALIAKKSRQLQKVNYSNTIILCFLILFTTLLIITFKAYRAKNNIIRSLQIQYKRIEHKNKLIDISLLEKNTLLQEVHHRVKNNLQIINSLFNLQANLIENPTALQALKEGRERIFAIALIHQILYQNHSLTSIPMHSYISKLTDQIHRAYFSEQKNITIKINADQLEFGVDTAVPIGLIICELSTNAFKYAYEGRVEGLFEIQINQVDGPTNYRLQISDNGIGFPMEALKTGLGTEIIEALTEQLSGTLTVSSSKKGSQFQLEFNEIL